MRDPKRIPKVLYKLKEVWEKYPDLRLCQLIYNVVGPADPCPGLYYTEDDEFLTKAERYPK